MSPLRQSDVATQVQRRSKEEAKRSPESHATEKTTLEAFLPIFPPHPLFPAYYSVAPLLMEVKDARVAWGYRRLEARYVGGVEKVRWGHWLKKSIGNSNPREKNPSSKAELRCLRGGVEIPSHGSGQTGPQVSDGFGSNFRALEPASPGESSHWWHWVTHTLLPLPIFKT